MKINAVRRNFNRNLLVLKKQSPHIFFVGGVAGVVTSTVLACRATLKLSDTLDEIKKDSDNIRGMKAEIENYPTDQYARDTLYVYTKASIALAKLYGPSIVIGGLSIGALTGSHIQLTRRNQALMAAYALVQKAYDEYRARVREMVGEEKELDIYHAARIETVKELGDVKTVDPNTFSPYAKFFDEYCPAWKKDPEMNRIYVQCQQNYANNLLHARGHLFLNEVYDMLGIDRTNAGAVVGWVVGKDGDNYVDFGLYEAHNSRFVNGWERSILLDFNVDGVIYDKI
jgi:Family of unknown function (DUF6353)